MIDLNATNEWQHRDADGTVLPWYTKSFLDELVTWELKDKVVFEYGGGASTVWWNKKAKHVFTVDNNEPFFEALIKHIGKESVMMYMPVENKMQYVNYVYGPHGGPFDIIIIDGEPIAWRDDCVKPALDCLKPGGKLIIDNWDQPTVGWLPSEKTKALLAPYPCRVFSQEGHPDWKTAVFTKV
jgi:predicted O-methyltransferase YrrM